MRLLCARQKRRCVNCRNGNECRNPSGREQGREREEEELGDNQESQEEGQQDGRQRDIEMPESPIALTPVSSPRTPPPPQHEVPQRTRWRKMREGTSSGKVKRKKKQQDGNLVGLRQQGLRQISNSVIYEMITGELVFGKKLPRQKAAGVPQAWMQGGVSLAGAALTGAVPLWGLVQAS
ncbi:hypothetical protein GWK47_045544 [Chionoecetes opilio]|uniref:Uncharacterized protein n=1 Tax=Chionoecetes opilio TaxID=41210 RepID=A0A8J4YCU6_CHIOP|nr:hypothetical protein GWK47_045544 [Chionoecetes opilio]